MGSFFLWLVLGAIAGWAAGKIMRGGGFGLIGNIVVGVIGGVIGGWVFGLFGLTTGSFIGSLITAIVGAVILLYVVSLIKK